MRLNKQERKISGAEKRAKANEGFGVFIFENNTSGDLILPRATKKGDRKIGKKQQFEGDDYYMQMVRTNDLKLIRIIQTKEQEMALSEKLLTEQPPTVTTEGTVELIKQNPKLKKLNETLPDDETLEDVLLNEHPMDGIEII